MNCSHHLEGKLYLSIPCVSLYHYRGHIGRGYFFVIKVTAETGQSAEYVIQYFTMFNIACSK